MRLRLIFPALAVFVAACEPAPKPLPPEAQPKLAQLSERVYVLHGANELPNPQNQGYMNNPGLVLTSKGVVVIDPGASRRVGEFVLAKIAEVSREPVIAVFNTHIHGDHWLANQAIKLAYPKAVIYAHANMKTRAEGAGADWVKLIDRMTEGALAGTVPLPPEVTVGHEETLKLGDRRFRFYHAGKAHTDGDLMIEVVEDSVMFVGDIAIHGRVGRMDDGSFKGNIAALEMALASPAKHFVPGHGMSGGREAISGYRDYFKQLYAAVKKHYDAGVSDYDMKAKVAEALAPFRHLKNFDSELGRHVSLAYLEIESEAF